MLKIGEFSKLSRVSIRMLRYYDEMGLLKPEHIHPDSGYRYYSEGQLLTAGRIRSLRDMGFGLCAIGELLARYEDKAALERCLLMRRAELLQEREEAEQRLRLLDTALERLRKDEIMKYDVTVKTIPARYAATVRAVIPAYEREGLLWHTLMKETKPLGLVQADPCCCCAVFHDREYKEADVEVEVQLAVKGSYQDTENVRFCTLPEVTVASAVCRGSYDQLGDAMGAVAQWVTDNGYEFCGPAFDIYHVSPYDTNNPDEYVTELCYPVRKL